MDGTNPKISFIPKGSLVREESFFERPRPRSVIGLLAIITFVAIIGTYAGFYIYNKSYEKEIISMRDKINKTKQEFSNAPQVEEAQLFTSRADIARSLLTNHTVVSPIFKFLSDSTAESVLYDKFSFKYNQGGSTVKISGEAPTYAALAFQADIFRAKTELLNFGISNVALTPFGSVSFELSLTFTPDFLSYAENLGSLKGDGTSSTTVDAQASSTVPMKTESTTDTPTPVFSPQDMEVPTATDTDTSSADTESTALPRAAEDTTSVVAPVEKPSALRSVWSKFKFW